jgi:cell division protein FtsN
MAKYDMKKRSASQTRKGSGFIRQLGLMSALFIAGYSTASFYDYTQLSRWVGDHLLANQSMPIAGKPSMKEADLPKPKFEFYTLLTQEGRAGLPEEANAPVVTTPPTPTAAMPMAAPPLPPPMDLTVTSPALKVPVAHAPLPALGSTQAPYVLQLASFTRRQDAERMKSSLAMKGFSASIVAVTQQHTHWYRVVLGPFVSRGDAQHAQSLIAHRERITGMIRKMDL